MKERPGGIDLWGPHSIEQAIRSGRANIREILVREGAREARTERLERLAVERSIPVRRVEAGAFRRMFPDRHAQGIVARADSFPYADLKLYLGTAGPRDLVVLLDHIMDPGNLGAIIRSAFAFHCGAVILPKDRAAQVTETVVRASAGAVWNLPVIQVTNMAQAARALADHDYWIVGADVSGPALSEKPAFPRDRLALVLGEEGGGLSRLVERSCDETISISHDSRIDSLNVSVAAAIMLYEFDCKRGRHD